MNLEQNDLNNKFQYCEIERDQSLKTLEICDSILKDQNKLKNILDSEITKYKEMCKAQEDVIIVKEQEVEELKKEKTTGKVTFGIVGLILGLIIKVPLPIGF